jgi:hypothetical protein
VQDNWADFLQSAEFIYNNSKHSTIGMTLFYCLIEYHPDFGPVIEDDLTGEKATAVWNSIANMHEQKKTAAEL